MHVPDRKRKEDDAGDNVNKAQVSVAAAFVERATGLGQHELDEEQQEEGKSKLHVQRRKVVSSGGGNTGYGPV